MSATRMGYVKAPPTPKPSYVAVRLGPYTIVRGEPPKYQDQVMARQWVLPGCRWCSWFELEAIAKRNGWTLRGSG